MLLHTICHPGSIFPEDFISDNYFAEKEEKSPESDECIELETPYYRILVKMESPNSARVVRLISSRAEDYLNPNLQPGVLLNVPYDTNE